MNQALMQLRNEVYEIVLVWHGTFCLSCELVNRDTRGKDQATPESISAPRTHITNKLVILKNVVQNSRPRFGNVRKLIAENIVEQSFGHLQKLRAESNGHFDPLSLSVFGVSRFRASVRSYRHIVR